MSHNLTGSILCVFLHMQRSESRLNTWFSSLFCRKKDARKHVQKLVQYPESRIQKPPKDGQGHVTCTSYDSFAMPLQPTSSCSHQGRWLNNRRTRCSCKQCVRSSMLALHHDKVILVKLHFLKRSSVFASRPIALLLRHSLNHAGEPLYRALGQLTPMTLMLHVRSPLSHCPAIGVSAVNFFSISSSARL